MDKIILNGNHNIVIDIKQDLDSNFKYQLTI